MNEPGLDGSFWPSESQKLLLRTAFGGDAAADAWARVRPGLDLDRLELGTFPLLPLVHRRLEQLGVDDPSLPRLAGIRRRSWYLNRVRAEQARAALLALEGAGGVPVVVDGWSAVARQFEGDFTVRAVEGLDVLVQPDRADDAEAALRGLGYERADDWLPHARRLLGREREAATIHTRLAHEFSDPAAGRELPDLTAAAVWSDLSGTPIRVLEPADELVRTCLNGARATRLPAVVWVADALALLQTPDAELDWARVERHGRTLHATLRLREALAYLAREHGADVPEQTLTALGDAPTRPRERVAHRLAGRGLPLVGPPPRTAVRFLQVTSDRPLPAALAGAAPYLCDELGVAHWTRLPLEVGRRARAALRLQRERPHRPPVEREGVA